MQDTNTHSTGQAEPAPPPLQAYTALALEFDESEGILNAVLSDSQSETNVSATSVQEMIDAGNYSSFFFAENATDDLLARVLEGQRGTYPLGERRNAVIQFSIATDQMAASVTTKPEYGGQPLTAESLQQAAQDAGIQAELCNQKVIEGIVRDKVVTNVSIAKGRKPQAGSDVSFTLLFEDVPSAQNVDETGNIDVYDSQEFLVVDEGTPLLRRDPATPGVDGCTVKGKVLKAQSGNDASFATGTSGAMLDPEDNNLLIAETKGHPVVLHNGVKVDPTLRVENVDLRTGNLVFDGSLLITGDATAGVLVEATGDVVVKGIVANATVIAGGNVLVSGGVIGPEPDDGEDLVTHIKTDGNIEAQFINCARIEAGGDVAAREYISHCETHSKDHILVGKGGRGWLFGGHSHADMGISANRLGTEANIKTTVSVGFSAEMYDTHATLSEERDQLLDQITQLKAVKDAQANNTQIDLEKLTNTIQAFEQQVIDKSDEIETLDAEMAATQNVKIEVKETVFPNVAITICGAKMLVQREQTGASYVRKDDEVERV